MERNLRTTKISSIDENAVEKDKMQQLKQIGQTKMEVKRAALGDLGNRNRSEKIEITKKTLNKNDPPISQKPIITAPLGATQAAIGDKARDPNINPKHVNCFKNIKPRVNTYWKKEEARKLTRKNSVKCTKITTATAAATSSARPKRTIAVKASNNMKEKTSSKKKPVATATVKNEGIVKPAVLLNAEGKLAGQHFSTLKISDSQDDQKQVKMEIQSQSTDNNSNEIEIKMKNELYLKEPEKMIKILQEVRNIDKYDANNIILVSEYANDIFAYLSSLEIEYPVRENHLDKQIEVTPRMRSILIDWINEVHYQFHLVPETYHMTVGIIDRYLQKVSTNKQQLQLVGVTALFIATKYEELYPLEANDLSYMTDNTYSREEIFRMEHEILKALDFNLSRPVSIHFLRRFSRAADATGIRHQAAKYLLELSTIDYSLSHFKPSQIAAGSLFLSLFLYNDRYELSKIDQLWTCTLDFYSKYYAHELLPIVKKLAKLMIDAPTSRYKSVYEKYRSEKFDKVSLHSQIYPEISNKLKKLCDEGEK